METAEAVKLLREHNKWNRDRLHSYEPYAKKLSIAIDTVCDALERVEKEKDADGRCAEAIPG